jgi:hypothetical protein
MNRTGRWLGFGGILLAVVALGFGCDSEGGDDAGPGVDGGGPGMDASAPLDGGEPDPDGGVEWPDGGMISGTIGPAGGTVGADNFLLTIPAGALNREVAITVERRAPTAEEIPEDMMAVGDAYVLGPSRTVFALPVTVRVTLPSPRPEAFLLWDRETELTQFVTDHVDSALIAENNHFSRVIPAVWTGGLCLSVDCDEPTASECAAGGPSGTAITYGPLGTCFLFGSEETVCRYFPRRSACANGERCVAGACEPIVLPDRCGDGIIQGPEQCDGDALGGATCETLGRLGGTLGCRPPEDGFSSGPTGGCVFDLSNCTRPYTSEECGNGQLDGGEGCDPGEGETVFREGLTCADLGYSEGTPVCNSDCSINYTTCSGGNPCQGVDCVAPARYCDESIVVTPASGTCFGGHCYYATAPQTVDCAAQQKTCEDGECVSTCGNGTREPWEQCEGTDLGGATCMTANPDCSGDGLACSEGCSFDTTECSCVFP